MNQAVDPLLDDIASIMAWLRGAAPEDGSLARLRQEVTTLFPDTPFLGFRTKRCIISRTVGRRPYIGPVADGVTVAMGCNGYSGHGLGCPGSNSREGGAQRSSASRLRLERLHRSNNGGESWLGCTNDRGVVHTPAADSTTRR